MYFHIKNSSSVHFSSDITLNVILDNTEKARNVYNYFRCNFIEKHDFVHGGVLCAGLS